MTTELLQTLVLAMQRRLTAIPKRLRLYTSEYEKLPHALILTGARGCGKSTFLLHHSNSSHSIHAVDEEFGHGDLKWS